MHMSLCREPSQIHCLPLCLTPAHPILYLALNQRPLPTNQEPKEAARSNAAVKSFANPLSCDKSLIFKQWTDPLGADRSGRRSLHRLAPLCQFPSPFPPLTADSALNPSIAPVQQWKWGSRNWEASRSGPGFYFGSASPRFFLTLVKATRLWPPNQDLFPPLKSLLFFFLYIFSPPLFSWQVSGFFCCCCCPSLLLSYLPQNFLPTSTDKLSL